MLQQQLVETQTRQASAAAGQQASAAARHIAEQQVADALSIVGAIQSTAGIAGAVDQNIAGTSVDTHVGQAELGQLWALCVVLVKGQS